MGVQYRLRKDIMVRLSDGPANEQPAVAMRNVRLVRISLLVTHTL